MKELVRRANYIFPGDIKHADYPMDKKILHTLECTQAASDKPHFQLLMKIGSGVPEGAQAEQRGARFKDVEIT